MIGNDEKMNSSAMQGHTSETLVQEGVLNLFCYEGFPTDSTFV